MSSGRQEIKLDELIRRSDAIVVARKARPYHLKERIPYPDTAEGDFEAIAYGFEVLSKVRDDEGLIKGKKLTVFSANTEDNFRQTVNHMRGRPVAMTLHPYYSGGVDPDKAGRFVIFIAYDRNTKRFSFAANGAVESEKNLGMVEKALSGPNPRADK